jgi:ribose 5-phosphate isomerase B
VKIAIGSDHAAFQTKKELKKALADDGHEIRDLGTNSGESTDYPDYAHAVAGSVADGENDRGILICGTGIGMCMSANKTPGIRAALVHDEFTTEMSRKHNNSNVLCMGARVLGEDTIINLAKLWLKTEFEGGRHARRVSKIEQ